MDEPKNSPHNNDSVHDGGDVPQGQERFVLLRQQSPIRHLRSKKPLPQRILDVSPSLLTQVWDFSEIRQDVITVVTKQRIAVKQNRRYRADENDIQVEE